jgi:hypothetical protein
MPVKHFLNLERKTERHNGKKEVGGERGVDRKRDRARCTEWKRREREKGRIRERGIERPINELKTSWMGNQTGESACRESETYSVCFYIYSPCS